MKKATIDGMELGNLIFGHSRGTYAIERHPYSQIFYDFLTKNGFDAYGYHKEHGDVFENEVFIIRPYYWGDDEALMDLPNFEYKPDDIKINWYKYPLRDAYCNKDIDINKFRDLLKECENSMKG